MKKNFFVFPITVFTLILILGCMVFFNGYALTAASVEPFQQDTIVISTNQVVQQENITAEIIKAQHQDVINSLKNRMEEIRQKYKSSEAQDAATTASSLTMRALAASSEIIEIWTFEDLDSICTDPGFTYVQMVDIDLSGHPDWAGIDCDFSGTYDGNNYKLIGLTVTESMNELDDAYGLFSHIAGGTVKNVYLEDVDIQIVSDIGVLCGFAENATIENCRVFGDIITDDGFVGGLVYYADNTMISNSQVSAGIITVDGFVGGLVQLGDNVTILNCDVTADITTTDGFVGGLIQYVWDSTIENCVISGSIDTTTGFAGGLAQYCCDATIVNCHVTESINAGGWVGGLIQYADNVNIEGCHVSGSINSGGWAGGFAEYISASILVNCSTSSSLTVTSYTFSGSFASSISGYQDEETTLSKCYATGDLSYVSDPDDSGGYMGGFVGIIDGYANISDCYARGSILGDIEESFTVGGFAGSCEDNIELTNCYSTGLVPIIGTSGGFLGENSENSSIITHCYYDSQTSGHRDNDGRGAPRTTSEMKTQSTYEGWDFNNTWAISPSTNDGYPTLSIGEIIPKDLLGKRPYCFYGNNSVNLSTGNFIRQETDVLIPGPGPGLHFTRFYNSLDDYEGPQGKGWTNNYNVHLTANQDGSISAAYADGHVYTFNYDGSDYTSPAGCYEILTSGPDDGYTLTFKNHTQYVFDSYGNLLNIIDQNNNIILLTYSSDMLAAATNQTTGKSLCFSYDANNDLSSVTDPAGRTVYYSYDSNGNLTTVENLNSGTTTYQYDSYGLTSITSPDGSTTLTNTYDGSNRVTQQADGENNTWQYTYNDVHTSLTGPLGDITVCGRDANYQGISLLDPLNNLTSFTYDDNNNCTGITDPNNNQVTYQYDANGNVISLTNAFGTTQYQYDENDNLILITDPGARTTQLSYDVNNNLSSITDALGATTSYTYYSDGQLQTQTNPEIGSGIGSISYTYSGGLPYTINDAVGMITTCSYDQVGRLLSITNNGGKTTSYSYDTAGNLLSITDSLGHSWSYQYDANYRLISATDANNNTTQYDYDNNGSLIQVTDALNNTTTYTYDSENQVVGITDPRGSTTYYTYDLNGRVVSVTDPLVNTWNYSYDEVGNITQIVDAMGNTTASCTYDPQKYLLTSIQDALGNDVSGQYDTLGRLTQTTDPLNQSTQYNYDDLDRHIQTTDTMQGQATQGFDALGNREVLIDTNSNQRQYSFDLAGRLTGSTSTTGSHQYAYNQIGLLSGFTNGRNQQRTWQYDDAGRLVSQNDPDGFISCTYDDNGNLLTVTDSSGTITRQHDALNRVTSYTDARGNTIGYTYDEAGNLITLTYPGGKQVQYTYDAANRLTQVSDWANHVTSYSYDANGRLLETHRPDGSVESRTYNEAGSLIQILDKNQGGTIITRFDINYDAAGNITDEYSNLSDPTNTGQSSEITCTSDNRLATYNGQIVSYDADGNITYGPLDGQMTSYSFDSSNRLTAAGNSSYTYDAEGNRTGVNINGEQYDYIINPHSSLSQVLVRTAADNSQTFYVYGLGLIGEEKQGNYKVYHYDLRGSTVKLTDAAGSVTDSFQYDVYGKLTDHTGSSNTAFLYNGQYGIMTDGNGLVYMRARYYNPDVHRFVSTDILEGNISDPLSLNRYTYCSNNPVNSIDPTGHEHIVSYCIFEYWYVDYNDNSDPFGYPYNYVDAIVRKHTFTNLNIVVYETSETSMNDQLNDNGRKFHLERRKAYEGKTQAFIPKGYYYEYSTIADLAYLDFLHRNDSMWKWSNVLVSGASDVVAIARTYKAAKASSKIRELFSPDISDAYGFGVDVYVSQKDPDISWLLDLIPIYGTYDAVIDATSNDPIKGVFVDR